MVESNALQTLLTLLHPDPVEAAENYRRLQHRLVRFFSLTAASDPQELTDATISRLARALEDATVAPADEPGDADNDSQEAAIKSPAVLVATMARQVLQEDLAQSRPNDREVREWFARSVNAPDPNRERRMTILKSCLARFTPDRRRLLESYYGWKPSHKAEHHQQLAQSLGISSEALRNKALRSRVQLESCIRKRKETSRSRGRRS